MQTTHSAAFPAAKPKPVAGTPVGHAVGSAPGLPSHGSTFAKLTPAKAVSGVVQANAGIPIITPVPSPAAPSPTTVVRRKGRLFSRAAAPGLVLPGSDVAAPARPVLSSRAAKREPVDPVVAQMTKSRPRTRIGTPLSSFHRALATPIAALFGVLGFAPGQLSIQSLTFTILGLVTAVDGQFAHMLAGGAMVYLGLLVDRADLVLTERRGSPGAWTMFLGLVTDRLVEVSLMIGLGILAVRGVEHPILPWMVLPRGVAPILAVAAGAAWLGRRAIEQAAETMLLRAHLLETRRLPGPNSVQRHGPIRPYFGRLLGRDELVVVCALGLALGQVGLAILVVLAAQAVLFLEALVLFHMRLRDPEGEASRVLGPVYP
jgi:hypothetical protein